MTHSRATITDLLGAGGLHPRRDLGQNFVADANTVRKIASLADVGPGDRVVEIGAGLGSLTLALAETGASITAIEVDPGVTLVLRRTVADLDNVEVVEADAMTIDWSALFAGARPWTLVANLPYNIGTPLVCDLLDTAHPIERFLVMVQREVAERFAASAGTKEYGAVSVKVAYWADASVVAKVPASVFHPRPKVESALVMITRRAPVAVDDPALARYQATPEQLFWLVKKGFGQRRKMLRRSLADIAGPDDFELARVEPTRRPESLDVHQWVRLAAAIRRLHPGRLPTPPERSS